MNKPNVDSCPHCEGSELFHQKVCALGPFGFNLLSGLGGTLSPASFEIVVCADCGHTMFFAEKNRLKRLTDERSGWKRLAETA